MAFCLYDALEEEEKVIYRSSFSWKIVTLDECLLKNFNDSPEVVSPLFQTWWQGAFAITLRYFFEGGQYKIKASPKLKVVDGSFHRKVEENVYFYITAFLNNQDGVSIFSGSHNSTSDKVQVNLLGEKCYSLKLRIKIEFHSELFSCSLQPALGILFEQQFQNSEGNEHLFDQTIRAGDIELKANKLILSAASPVFSAVVSQMKENKTNVVDITDIDVDTVKSFLTCIHTFKRPEFKDMESAVNLYRMSEQYRVPVLKNLCKNYIISNEESTT